MDHLYQAFKREHFTLPPASCKVRGFGEIPRVDASIQAIRDRAKQQHIARENEMRKQVIIKKWNELQQQNRTKVLHQMVAIVKQCRLRKTCLKNQSRRIENRRATMREPANVLLSQYLPTRNWIITLFQQMYADLMIQKHRGVRSLSQSSNKKTTVDPPLAFAPIDRLTLMNRLSVQGYVPLWDRGTLWKSEACRFWNALGREEQSFRNEAAKRACTFVDIDDPISSYHMAKQITYGFENEFIRLHKCLYASVWRPYGGATLSLRKVLRAWRTIITYNNNLQFMNKPFGQRDFSTLLLSAHDAKHCRRQGQYISHTTECRNDEAFRNLPWDVIRQWWVDPQTTEADHRVLVLLLSTFYH